MQTNSYPKILLVGSFSWYTANGITVHNLFGKWPKGMLAILSTNIDDITKIYSEKIHNYYILGKSETIVRKPYYRFFKSSKSRAYQFESRDDFEGQIANLKPKSAGKNENGIKKSVNLLLRYQLIKLLGLKISLKRRVISAELKNWIDNFSPDFIYCTSSNIDDMDLAINLKKEFSKSLLIFHTFDDFVHSIYQETLFPWYWKKKLQTKFNDLLKHTDLNFTISQKMADEYRKKFSTQFYPFHNPVDLDFWQAEVTQINNKDEFIFLYTGKVNEDTADAIKDFYYALANITLSDFKLDMKIFSPYEYKVIKSFLGDVADKISIEKFDYNELPEKMANADAMLLALNNNKRTFKYIRLSMLTKATEYMATKKPIFLFTPKSVAVAEYLTEQNAAYFLDSHSSGSEISKAIKIFVEDKALRQQLADRAYNLCVTKHTSEANTQRLLELMNTSI